LRWKIACSLLRAVSKLHAIFSRRGGGLASLCAPLSDLLAMMVARCCYILAPISKSCAPPHISPCLIDAAAGAAGTACKSSDDCYTNLCLKGLCVCTTSTDCFVGGVLNDIDINGFNAASQGRCRAAVNPADRRCIASGKLNLLPNGCTEDYSCPSESGLG